MINRTDMAMLYQFLFYTDGLQIKWRDIVERFTTYQRGVAVLRNEADRRRAIRKLAELEDLEEMVMKRAMELYVLPEVELKAPGERIEVLGLSTRVMNILKQNQIRYLDELCGLTECELMRMRHFGEKALDEIKIKLKKYGRELGK